MKNDLHGIVFKGRLGQGVLARFAIWPPCFKQTDVRPKVALEIPQLIRTMSLTNPY
jgi:hypothetical protein